MDGDDADGYSDRYNVRICGFVRGDILKKRSLTGFIAELLVCE